MDTISVTELKKRLDAGEDLKVIDVREEYEFENDHIEAQNIPMGEIPSRLDELSSLKEKEFVVCCRSGGRSGNITMFLNQYGFTKAKNLSGGMMAWKAEIDPSFNVE